MIERLMKDALLLAAGAAIGAAGAMWLMSESGKEARGELKEFARQAKDKLRECREQLQQAAEELDNADRQSAPEA